MSEKTVPTPADGHNHQADTGQDEKHDPRNEDLVDRAKSDKGETPNRDEDEFTRDHLEEPDVDLNIEEHVNENSDER